MVLPECIQSLFESVHTGSWHHMSRQAVPVVDNPLCKLMGFYCDLGSFSVAWSCVRVVLPFIGVIRAGSEPSYMSLSNLYVSTMPSLSLLKGREWEFPQAIWIAHVLKCWYFPDSKVHGANMWPIWGRQDPGAPHVGPMNFAIWVA